MTQGNTPEDDIEEKEQHEVDDSTKVVNFVSLHPVRIPTRIVTEGINLISRLPILLVLNAVLAQSESWIDSFGLSTRQDITF